MNGEQIRKNIEEKIACISETWMSSEYDERVKDYWKKSGYSCIVKMIDDAGLEDEVKKLNTLSLHLGDFVLSNSERIMNNFFYRQLMDFLQTMFITQTMILCKLRINIGIK